MSASRWNWSDRLAVPTTLLVAEAAWVTLALDAALTHARIDVAYLTLVLPAALVLACSSLCSRARLPRAARVAAAAVFTIAAMSVSAGLIGIGLAHANFTTIAWMPWRIRGTHVVACTWAAWSVALVSCGRGLSLGARPVSFLQAVVSASSGIVAFVLLFVVDTVDRDAALQHRMSSMLWSVVLFIACTMVVLVATRRAEIDRDARRSPSTQSPSRGGGTAVALVAVLTVSGLLVATGFALVAPDIGRALGAVARGIAAAIAWLWDQIPWGHHRVRVGEPKSGSSRSAPVKISLLETVLGVTLVAACLLIVSAIAMVRLGVARRRRTRTHTDPDEEEEEWDSVFTWRHLLAQTLAWLRRLLSRSRRLPDPSVTSLLHSDHGGVRAQYRRLLAASAHEGVTRRDDETANEFECRLAQHLSQREEARTGLSDATRAYEAVRYGGRSDADLVTSVRHDVDQILNALACREHAGGADDLEE